MTTANTASKKATEFPNETVLNIPLSDIFADYDWNVRSKSDISDVSDAVRDTTVKGGTSEGTGMPEFAKNFADVGQDTAGIVREVVNGKSLSGKPTKAKYELIAGFRRLTAVKLCNEDKELTAAADKAGRLYVPTQPNGTYRAVVRTFANERAARVLNIRENTARNNLKTPDLVIQVRDLAKEGMSQVAIAEAIGVTQGFVSKLLKVATLPKPVLEHWRNGNASPLPGLPADKVYPRIPMPDLAVLAELQSTDKLPESEVIARYIEMVNPTPAEGSTGSGATKEEKDAARVIEFGKMVARLVYSGFLAAGDLQWTKVIGPKSANFMVDAGSKDYAKVMEKCDLAGRAYSEELAELANKDAAKKSA